MLSIKTWAHGRASLNDVPVEHYPDGTPLIRYPKKLVAPNRIVILATTIGDLMTGLFYVDAVKRHSPADHQIELVIPYVPGARQDRILPVGSTPENDMLKTAHSVAREINARKAARVWILDPHSSVIDALIERSEKWMPADFADQLPHEYCAVISPDAGAEKRAGEMAEVLKVPLVRAWKKRDPATGKLSGFGVENYSDIVNEASTGIGFPRVLVVDDICDGGGTFIGLSQMLAQRQIAQHYLDLWVSHGLFTKGLAELTQHYDNIYTTDSIARPESPSGVTIIPVLNTMVGIQ